MKKILISIILIIMAKAGYSQNNSVSISNEVLQQIEKSFVSTPSDKAIQNAVSANELKKLSVNRENIGKTDFFFKYKVDVSGITDQKSSGRCWMFTGLNILRPKVIKNYNLSSFEFSTNYLYFYDLLEKANLFLEGIILSSDKQMDDKTVEWFFKNPIGDGGVWNSLTNLVEKYGLVPKEAMPETNSSESTSALQKVLTTKLRENGLELRKMKENKSIDDKIRTKKIEMLGDVYRILVLNLGKPPKEFSWRYQSKDGIISPLKSYTPKSFFSESLPNVNFTDYVLLMNDPSRPYYKLYEIEYDRNVMEGRNWLYINLPVDEIKKFAITSIKSNEAMYFSCDVGKQLNTDAGLLSLENYDYQSLYGVKFGMDKKDRIITFESGSSHGMALVAADVDANEKPTKWMVENSWGASSGHNGYLAITDGWFNEYMFRVVVLKKFIDEKTLEILKQTPTKLPPWDPMFLKDE
jgi:bleomycin hydrolase